MKEKADSGEQQEFFKERGFGLRMGFGKRAAVIVVDYMRAFTDASMPLGSNLDEEIAQTNRILDSAHEHHIPVFFTVVYYEDEAFRDAGIWALKQKGVSTLKAGTPEVELDPRLHRRSHDQVILKKFASSFFGSDLVSRLIGCQADTLIITGCTTSGCVRATAVDACQYGFRPIVVRGAVGDRSVAAHEQSLFDLHAKYADVVSVEEVLAHFQTHGQHTGQPS